MDATEVLALVRQLQGQIEFLKPRARAADELYKQVAIQNEMLRTRAKLVEEYEQKIGLLENMVVALQKKCHLLEDRHSLLFEAFSKPSEN